jgi:ATP-binding cassette subfamily F protein uup
MAKLLLNLRGITHSFGGKSVLKDAELALAQGECLALVGRNGSGKSTLLRIAAGLIDSDHGDRWLQPGTTVRYLPQEPSLAGFSTVLEYVAAGLGPADDKHRCILLLRGLGLTGNENPLHLSGGELRRAALVRTLAPRPDILLLDEPTNHLDLPAIEWLEAELQTLNSTKILISHDRRFLQKLTGQTVWLDRGIARRFDHGFSQFEPWRDRVLEEEEVAQAKLAQRIATEENWMRYGVTARRKRNMRRVALLRSLRKERRDRVGKLGNVSFGMTTGDQSGRLVASAQKVSKSYAGRTLIRDLNLLVMRGDRIGIVGPNGSGKTTLIKLLTGALEPDAGSVRLGTNLQIVTLDQSRQSLAPNDTLASVISGGRGDHIVINGEMRHVVGYMKDFLFRPDEARTPVSILSGGERVRLILARELAKPSNFLVLDEPTNDLDLETLDLLQELLADYPGTILLVSHDRDFLDRIATSILMCEGDGGWQEYAGGYTDMVTQRGVGVGVPKQSRGDPKPVSSGFVPNTSAAIQRKLSFKEKHALETLPTKMEQLTAEIAGLESLLADPQLYARDPNSFGAAAGRIAAARNELAQAEIEWLEIEIKREQLEGN